MHNNRETVIIPQTIIVPTQSIIVASLCMTSPTAHLRSAGVCGSVMKTSQIWTCRHTSDYAREAVWEWARECERVRAGESERVCERVRVWESAVVLLIQTISRERVRDWVREWTCVSEWACECAKRESMPMSASVRECTWGCACESVCGRECESQREHVWARVWVWECCGAVDPDYLSWESARVWAMMTVFCTWSTCKACMIMMVSTLELSSVNVCTIILR